MSAAVYYLLFSLCLLLRFVLNCDAKVQTYLETTKQKTKNLCLFNLLQQISMVLPKFIHILSTKTGKCAIYKANIFVCSRVMRVHYIITNNKLSLYSCCSRINVAYIQNYHHYKLIISFSCSCVLCCVSYAVADMWMMIYCYLCPCVRVPCLVVFRTCWGMAHSICAY